ncbi:MAG: NAD(P)/FAD-dependent oxidoreductase [Ahrensia sp.]|nr:NAD(P)/FAD-dependent oxidoreductase [Ahrensia sp.]
MTSRGHTHDVIVLGAGGAGLMCAGVASQRGRKVLLVDHNKQPGRKILISGGGRCNFTNVGTEAANFLSQNPHFAKSALSRYTPRDFVALVDRHGIAWHEKMLGQLFCDGSAQQIVDMLVAECVRDLVEFAFGAPVERVTTSDDGFQLALAGQQYSAGSLVVATGGPSIPKLGATGFAYDLARQFGLKVVEPRPALVPFTLAADEALFKELSGVATQTVVRFGKAAFREASLFTHKGLSGPAMLQISSYWRHGEAISVDFLPERTGEWLLAHKRKSPKRHLQSVLCEVLPDRLAQALCARLDGTSPIGQMGDKALSQAQAQLKDWSFRPSGTEGFAKAEVTVGGVSTAELSSRDMSAKRVPGLHFIGECVDVTGWLGGYNFQWAWASGVAAGEAV